MGNFRIKTCVLGQVSTNCYLIYREGSGEAVIVDPGDNAPYILNKCRELEVTPSAILLTHGHFDHILAVEDIKRAFRIDVYAGDGEKALLANPRENLTESYGGEKTVSPDKTVKDGGELEISGLRFKVLETPGHTAGSVCYWLEDEGVLLSGDTLFAESVGRTDLPTGNTSDIIESVTKKLFLLPEDTMVYPGHGEPTTIGREKKCNPIVRRG